jgi:hypothetical protein
MYDLLHIAEWCNVRGNKGNKLLSGLSPIETKEGRENREESQVEKDGQR